MTVLRTTTPASTCRPNGTLSSTYATLNATLATPGATSTTFTLPVNLPRRARTASPRGPGTPRASRTRPPPAPRRRYLVYPGDLPPTFDPTLGAPVTRRVVHPGRDRGQRSGERRPADRPGAGRHRQQPGPVHELVRHVHEHDPELPDRVPEQPGQPRVELRVHLAGHPGRACTRWSTRAIDQHNFSQRAATSSRTSPSPQPAEPPAGGRRDRVAACRTSAPSTAARSTDENAPALTYSWNFGQGTARPARCRSRRTPRPGRSPSSLTVKDQWGADRTFTMAAAHHRDAAGQHGAGPDLRHELRRRWPAALSSSGTVDPNTGRHHRVLVELRGRHGAEHEHLRRRTRTRCRAPTRSR